MNAKLKFALYVGLLGCLLALALGFRAAYRAADTRVRPAAVSTNVMAISNQMASTNPAVAATNPPAGHGGDLGDEATLRQTSPRMGRLMGYGVALFFTLVGLAVLI